MIYPENVVHFHFCGQRPNGGGGGGGRGDYRKIASSLAILKKGWSSCIVLAIMFFWASEVHSLILLFLFPLI